MLLYVSRREFFNDICDEIRLFMPLVRIEQLDTYPFSLEEDAMCVELSNDSMNFIAAARFEYGGRSYCCRHSSPYINDTPLIEKRYAKRCVKTAAFRALKQAFPNISPPWGSLTGIRPTSMLRNLQDSFGSEYADMTMLNEFNVSEDKLRLSHEIVSRQSPVLSSIGERDFDVYIGIPFCRTRCLYCSFASELRSPKTDMRSYLDALKRDIASGAGLARDAGLNLRAVYIGGGTPTILTAAELDELLDFTVKAYEIEPQVEFTVEAGRPDTISVEKLRVLKNYCVDRISINPQTMSNATLRRVGRDHTSEDIYRCFYMARETGFNSINMDIICGLPGECSEDVNETLEKISLLAPDCLTVHTLAIKRSSRLKEQLSETMLPSSPEVEKMLRMGARAAAEMHMIPYYMYRQKYMTGNMENVGYSLPGKICVYNIDMMEDAVSIIAHGAGSMTKRVFSELTRIERIPNPKDVQTYVAKLEALCARRAKLFSNI